MNNNWKLFLFVGAFIIVAGLTGIFAIGASKENKSGDQNGTGSVAGATSDQDDYINRLAKHLSESGMVLYGTNTSEETANQKAQFGQAANTLDFVDCDVTDSASNPDECMGQNITVYPTWIYEGQKYEGAQSLSDLAKITNFEQ